MFHHLMVSSLWSRVDELDKWLFVKINSGTANAFFDAVLPFFRESVFWAPFYVFLLAFVTLSYGRRGWWWSVAFICSVALTDLIGTYVFKVNFERLRPCQDPFFFNQVRLVIRQCSGSYSFISNHAANHFGLATFMFFTFRKSFRHWSWLLYLWALLIAYAQVYVGVHYPGDVLAGALVGLLTGRMVAKLFHKNFGYFSIES